MAELYIALTEDDFRRLVRGEIVKRADDKKLVQLNIVLQDIGWIRMEMAIEDARHGSDPQRGDELQEKGGFKGER